MGFIYKNEEKIFKIIMYCMQPVIRIEEGYILHAILARGWVGGPSNPAFFCKNRMQCKTGEALDTVLRRYRGGINLLLGKEIDTIDFNIVAGFLQTLGFATKIWFIIHIAF